MSVSALEHQQYEVLTNLLLLDDYRFRHQPQENLYRAQGNALRKSLELSLQGGKQEALMAMKQLQTALRGGGGREPAHLFIKLVVKFSQRKRKKILLKTFTVSSRPNHQ